MASDENNENEARGDSASDNRSVPEVGAQGGVEMHDSHSETTSTCSEDVDSAPDDTEAIENLINVFDQSTMLHSDGDTSDKTMSLGSNSTTSSSDKENNPDRAPLSGQPSAKYISNLLSTKDTMLTSPIWAPLMTQIRNLISRRGINKVVVLALGSLYRHYSIHGNWLLELSFIFAIQQLLYDEITSKGEDTIPDLIFQDPDFTTHDVTLLTSLGITVVAHPTALYAIDAQTFVHARCPPWPLLYNAIIQTRPAVLLTGPLAPRLEARARLREDETYRGWVLWRMWVFLDEMRMVELESTDVEEVNEDGEGAEVIDWMEEMVGYVLK